MCGGLSGGRGRTEGHRARWRTGVIPGSLRGEVISQESSGMQTGHSVVRVSSAHVWPSASFLAVAAECHRPEGLSVRLEKVGSFTATASGKGRGDPEEREGGAQAGAGGRGGSGGRGAQAWVCP